MALPKKLYSLKDKIREKATPKTKKVEKKVKAKKTKKSKKK